MAVKDWSTTAASNTAIIDGMSLDGSIMQVNQTDNAFRDIAAQIASQLGKMGFEGADIASATTTNLANATGWSLDITGTTTITGFGTVDAGQVFILRFTGALTLTHSSALILPSFADITTAASDVAFMKSEGSGNWRCVSYQRASGVPIGSPSSTTDNGVPRFDGTSGAMQTSALAISDTGSLTGVNVIRTEDGSAAAAAYGFTASGNIGMYRRATNQLGLGTAGLEALWIDENQRIFNVASYNNTSASAANAGLTSAGGFYRSTSARKYKDNIAPISDEDIAKAMLLSGITYTSKCANDDKQKRHIGIIADQAHDAGLVDLVTYGADGDVEGFQYERLTALLLEIVKRQNARIAALES